jgi:F-type H+-transporting ATPase subunit b
VVHVAPIFGTVQADAVTGQAPDAPAAQPDNPILPTPPELAWGGATFLLLWVLMKFVLVKPIMKTMEERSTRIQRDLGNAEELKAEAATALTEYEQSLLSARTEASRIIDEARAEAEQERRQILAEAEAEVAQLRAQANAEVSEAKAEALQSMRASVSAIAVQAAELVVQKRFDEATQRAIVDEYLNRASQN